MSSKKRSEINVIPPKKGDISTALAGVELASYQGKRPYQEDRFVVQAGVDIDAASSRGFLADIFQKAAAETDDMVPGSTATGVVITKDQQITVAFLGDSPVVLLVRDPKTGEVVPTKITRDHHPDAKGEKERIEAAHGLVGRDNRLRGVSRDGKRINSLAVSRAFGDDKMIGLSRDPEFATIDLKAEIAAGKEVYIVVSSDGLYDGAQPSEFAALLDKAITDGKQSNLADIFANQAYKGGSSDNITALVYKVPAKMDVAMFLGLADGHGGAATSQKVIETFTSNVKAKITLT